MGLYNVFYMKRNNYGSNQEGLTLWRPLLSYGYNYKALPDRVKPSFVIVLLTRALRRSGLSVRVLGCQKLQITA